MQYRYDPNANNPLREFFERFDRRKSTPLVLAVVVLLLILLGLFSSYYTVEPEGKAVVKRFGAVVAVKGPGLHFKLPWGIERAYFVPTERVLKEEFGFRTIAAGQRSTFEKTAEQRKQSLMLTGDLNVIDVEWVVQYRINDPDRWLHAVRDQEETIRVVAESVMRRVVGNRLGSVVLTTGRAEIAAMAQREMQKILDTYNMGVHISTIEMQDVTPPEPVKNAFNEVNEARQQREQYINEAEKRRNEVIPRAEGEGRQLKAEAEGYLAQRINRAKGEADRFKAIYSEYKQAPEVTRQRLYLEMIDKVMANIGKVYIVEKGQPLPLPLLNLTGKEK